MAKLIICFICPKCNERKEEHLKIGEAIETPYCHSFAHEGDCKEMVVDSFNIEGME